MSTRSPFKTIVAMLLAVITAVCAYVLYTRSRDSRDRLHSDSLRIESVLKEQVAREQ